MTEETAAAAPKEKKEEKRMAKTARPKNVTIDDKAYVKCPYPDCGYMVEEFGYNPKLGVRRIVLYNPKDDIHEHIREVHKLVWLRKGKTAGWWSLSKFRHPKQEEQE